MDRIVEALERGALVQVVQAVRFAGRALALAVLLGGAALLASWLVGCTDPIGDQARAAVISADVLSAGGEAVTLARDRALDRVEEAHPTDPEHDAELDREAARWRPVGMALDEARLALAAWIDALDLARIAGTDASVLLPIVRVAARAVQLTVHAFELAEDLGVDGLPTIPPIVLQAANAIGGQ